MKNCIMNIISILLLGTCIASFIFLIKVFNGTKDDPFDITLTDDTRRRYILDNSFSSYENKSKNENETVNNFCTNEQISQGCENISFNKQSNSNKFIRNLMSSSECQKYIDKIQTKEKLNQVFNLKLKGVHQMAIGLMVIYIATFIVIVLLILSPICSPLIVVLIIPIICTLYFGILVNIILFIIICIRFYNGDTHEYVSFLDCRGINEDKFHDDFKDVEKLKTNFLVFMILNIIYIVCGLINNCYSNSTIKGKKTENVDPEVNKNNTTFNSNNSSSTSNNVNVNN